MYFVFWEFHFPPWRYRTNRPPGFCFSVPTELIKNNISRYNSFWVLKYHTRVTGVWGSGMLLCYWQANHILKIKLLDVGSSMCQNIVWSVTQLCLFATPWTVSCQGPLSMGFSRQGYRSGLPCPPPGDLPSPRTEPISSTWQADSFLLSHQGSPCLHIHRIKLWSCFPS